MDQKAPDLNPMFTTPPTPPPTVKSPNPLAKHFRTPAIYIKLPSGGSFWSTGSLSLPVTGELGVLPMTTKDEIILKTPDALMNGQGLVSVIESCCPNIADAWATPSIDVDALVIAIRIASYGNKMDFNSSCPHCAEFNEYAIDLRSVLDGITTPDYSQKIEINGLKIKLKPQDYSTVNKANMIRFEEQQVLRTLTEMDETNKLQMKDQFDHHLNNLIELNIETLAKCTDYIEIDDGTVVSNSEFINEFYVNCDNKVIKEVQKQLTEFAKIAEIKPVDVTCDSCSEPFKVSIDFDWASFFATGS